MDIRRCTQTCLNTTRVPRAGAYICYTSSHEPHESDGRPTCSYAGVMSLSDVKCLLFSFLKASADLSEIF